MGWWRAGRTVDPRKGTVTSGMVHAKAPLVSVTATRTWDEIVNEMTDGDPTTMNHQSLDRVPPMAEPDIGEMAPRTFDPPRLRVALRGRPWWSSVDRAYRFITADLRALPHFVIVGAQRAGTTSLYMWLSSHPSVAPPLNKEVHYFDVHYQKGRRWYKAHFPLAKTGRVTGEASPYLLFHPLAPERAAHDLPMSTRFIVLLREPVQRAISHYWYSRQFERWETESLERAIELEPYRLRAVDQRVREGERSFGHATFSYLSRGEYATQLRSWFKAVGRERILVLESEKLFSDAAARRAVLDWLCLSEYDQPFPNSNQFERLHPASPDLVRRLQEHFEPHNRELFELLGYELWTR